MNNFNTSDKKILEVKNICKTYQSKNGEVEALKNINFDVKEGEFISIIGPSGCGKSTLLSIIAGLEEKTSGEIYIDGKMGYMLQRDNLLEWRTIYKNVLLGLEIKKALTEENKAYVMELLKKYDLYEFRNKYPTQLSGGMRQRVALIRTLAIRPNILLLDEAFSALDYQTRLMVTEDIYNILKNENITALMVTHDISEAISMSDRVVVLTQRPATVEKIHTIDFEMENRTPLNCRENPKFSKYFNLMWKELEKDEEAKRKKYLRKIKINKIKILAAQIAILIIFIALWEILANTGKIDSFITSQPSRIFKTFLDLSSNNLLEHLKITCIETLVGFLLGTVLGALIAIILWWSPFISKVSEPFLVVLNALPKIALGPVIIIWVGAGMQSIIVMALAISLIVTILDILNGLLLTDKEKIKMAETFNANKFQILTKIVIPANIPTLFNTLKVNIGLSLVGVISGEFLVSKGGLGYLIVYGGQVFKLDLVMTSVIILAIVASIMYESIVILEKKIVK